MRKILAYIIFTNFSLLSLILSSCEDKKDIIESSHMNFIVFSEKLLSSVVTTDNSFVMITKNTNGLFITQIDTLGNKSNITPLSTFFSTANITNIDNLDFLQASDNTFFTVVTYSSISSSDTVPSFCVIKSDLQGNVLWNIYADIKPVNNRNVILQGAFPVQNGGIVLIYAPPRDMQNQTYFLKADFYDVAGNISKTAISDTFGDYSAMTFAGNNSFYVFPRFENNPGPVQPRQVVTFDETGLAKDTFEIQINFNEIRTIKNINGKIALTGLIVTGPGEQSTASVIYDLSLNPVFRKDFSGFVHIYGFESYSGGYLFSGVTNTQREEQSILNIYANLGSKAFFTGTNAQAEIQSNYNPESEYLTTGVASIAVGSSHFAYLFAKKSFDAYENLVLIKQ